jgi:ribosomal protein L11 methyltransferase
LKWIELSLSVDGELAEAVSEVLSRYAPGGVAVELTVDPDRAGQPTGAVAVRTYLPVDANLGKLKEAIERGLWHLGQIRPLPPPVYRELEATDWENAWRERYHPMPIGSKLLILPPWYEVEAGERKALIIEPGMAFGTGTHPTTQLCLRLLETRLTPGATVVDLGCGSGILSIAAALLGAAQVLALDIDRAAVEITNSNAARNDVADAIIARQGSVEDVARLVQDYGASTPSLLVANILATVLETMLESGLAECVAPGGSLILSGILEEQLPDLLTKAREKGLAVKQIRGDGDWRAVDLEREQV